MKTSSLLLPLACLALVACSKPAEPAAESTETPAAKEISVAEVPAAAIAKAEAVVAEVEAKSAAAVAELETSIAAAKTDTTKLFNDAVAKAKSYLGDHKFDLALASLDSLKGLILTEEQQKLATDLRAQITKAQELYQQAKGATKNLFGK